MKALYDEIGSEAEGAKVMLGCYCGGGHFGVELDLKFQQMQKLGWSEAKAAVDDRG